MGVKGHLLSVATALIRSPYNPPTYHVRPSSWWKILTNIKLIDEFERNDPRVLLLYG